MNVSSFMLEMVPSGGDEVERKFIARFWEAQGYQPKNFTNPYAYFSQLSSNDPTILIVDYQMPEPKTVAKWKKHTAVSDLKTDPKEVRSTVLTVEEETIIVVFRKHTLLPLDDYLYALQSTISHLTRSALHRCLQRHGISRLPDVEHDKPAKQKFKAYPIG